MLRVSLAFSGKAIVDLDMQEIEDKSAKSIKRWLAGPTGLSRFWQRLFLEDHSEVTDDDLPLAPQSIRLVALDFCPADVTQDEELMSASSEGDMTKVERILQ